MIMNSYLTVRRILAAALGLPAPACCAFPQLVKASDLQPLGAGRHVLPRLVIVWFFQRAARLLARQ
jgi:hypothetical protein